MIKLTLFICLFISVNSFAQSTDSLHNKDGVALNGKTFRTRSQSTLNNNSNPLIVLDGVPLETPTEAAYKAQIEAIDAGMIEKIDVLKGESATAIYGIRGANGVIIITSKNKKKKN